MLSTTQRATLPAVEGALDDIDIGDSGRVPLCGPTGFLTSMREEFLDREVAQDRIHDETVGPALVRTGSR